MTLFVAPVTASGQVFYSYDVEGGQLSLVGGLGYFYGIKYSNGGTGYAGSYDPQGFILYSADTTITKAVIPSTYTGYATSSSGGDYEEGEGPYIEDEPITGIQGIAGSNAGAFANCTLLTSVTIPSTVKYIYGGAFANCTSLTEVIFEDNDYYCYVDGAIYTKDMTTLVCYIDGSRTSFVVPDGVTEIGDFAFVGAPSLTSITIPASVTKIGVGALTGTGLTSVTFEQGSPFTAENNLILSADKTKVISYYGDVNGVAIPINVTEICDYAFWGATDNLDGAYSGARRRISNIYYQGTETQWANVIVGESNIPSYSSLNVYYSTYAVFVDDVENGTVMILGNTSDGIYMDNWDNSGSVVTSSGIPAYDLFVEEGATVTISAYPDTGYSVLNVSVTDDNGKGIDVTQDSSYSYSFTMPASNVNISVSFGQVVIHTFTQTDSSTFTFNFSDYLTDYSVGDYIVIGAVLSSDNYFSGTLSAESSIGTGQSTFSDSSGTNEPVTVYLGILSEYDYPNGSGQIELSSISGTYVNVVGLVMQKARVVECTHANLTHVEATNATCIEDGSDEYWYCSTCGKYFSDENATTEIELEDTVVEATGHSYEETVTEPTCTEGGYTTHTCSDCGDSYTDSETEALGHDYSSEITTEPTCTETGVMTYTCSRCGDSYTEDIEATGHSYVATDSSATCTEGGYTTYVCSECGDTYTDNATEPLGHDYTSEVTTEPTCTETGIMTYTCSRCGDSYTEEIAATGHTTETQNAKDATCTEVGYTGDTVCTVCGETIEYGEVIAALGHTEAEAVRENEVAATCTEAGSYESVVYCSVCGEELSRETIAVDATGHTKGTAVRENYVAPTATTAGSYDSVVYCTVCGEELSRETVTVPATGVMVDLSTILADYTAINNAIAKANALNASDYTNFYEVTNAINAVNWSYSVLQQSGVNTMATKIETAIANLIPANTVSEEVKIDDPVEDTNTKTEDEGETVSEPEVSAETNPTTGVALSLVPLAIAALAIVSSKRK